MARPRIIHKIKNDSHGFYLRLRVGPRKVMWLRFSDRTPDQQKYDGADRRRNQIAPEIGDDLETQFFEKKSTDDRAHKPDGKIVQQASAPAENLRGEPSGEQSDDDPGDDAHGLLPNSGAARVGNLYNWPRNASALRLSALSATSVSAVTNRHDDVRRRAARRLSSVF